MIFKGNERSYRGLTANLLPMKGGRGGRHKNITESDGESGNFLITQPSPPPFFFLTTKRQNLRLGSISSSSSSSSILLCLRSFCLQS